MPRAPSRGRCCCLLGHGHGGAAVSNEGTLANRVVTSKVFDCAARLGDRCLGAGPAGAALVKFSEDAASTSTNVLDASGDVGDACLVHDRVVCVGGGMLWSHYERFVDDIAYDLTVPRHELFATKLKDATLVVAGEVAVLLKGDNFVKSAGSPRCFPTARSRSASMGSRIVHVGTDGLRTCDSNGDNVEFHGTYVVNRFCCASIDGSRISGRGPRRTRSPRLLGPESSRRKGYLMKIHAVHVRGSRVAVACGLDVLILTLDTLDTMEGWRLPDPASDVRLLKDGTLAVLLPDGVLVDGKLVVAEKRPGRSSQRQHHSDGRRGRRELS